MSESQRQLADLLADPEIHRLIASTAEEYQRTSGIPADAARESVLAAMAEPTTLAYTRREWPAAKQDVTGFTMKIIIKRLFVEAFLKELRADLDFKNTLHLVAREVAYTWYLAPDAALRSILSAIGVPHVLAGIYKEWTSARRDGGNLGLVKVIVRRRVIDWLHKDARRAGHDSLRTPFVAVEVDAKLGSLDRDPQHSPLVQLMSRQGIDWVQEELDCFGNQGRAKQRQAWLLRRRILDETSYSALSTELQCNERALRVRMHKALRALRKHVQKCHGGLL